MLVAERRVVAMVARDGCIATASAGSDDTGDYDEMRVRCPRPERIAAWFASVDPMIAGIAVEAVADEEKEDLELPAAELVTPKGDLLRVKQRADAAHLATEVRAFTAELAAAEMPSPGPRSANGWEMFRVAGPAHVFLGGSATAGVLDARMSTSGQYLCEFVATTTDGPIRASKSGWVTPSVASSAIDDVLQPFAEVGGSERRNSTYAVAFTGGAERRANAPSTAAVFVRFNHIQDALGDACLPELDPPSAAQIGL